jgi:hypothetical protein
VVTFLVNPCFSPLNIATSRDRTTATSSTILCIPVHLVSLYTHAPPPHKQRCTHLPCTELDCNSKAPKLSANTSNRLSSLTPYRCCALTHQPTMMGLIQLSPCKENHRYCTCECECYTDRAPGGVSTCCTVMCTVARWGERG